MVAANSTKTPPADRVLVIHRMFNAPRNLVFKAWSKPEYLARWWGPRDFTLAYCQMDFKPGGAYRFCMRSPEQVDYWVWGVYREILEPERLVFTWERKDAQGNPWVDSVVTLTFEEQGDKTKFTLHQAVFKAAQDRDQHEGGWSQCLDRLGEYVSALNTGA